MNETTKTVIITAFGAVLLSLGIYFLPSKADFTTESKVGQVLFPDLLDGNKAQGMEIVSFDEKLSIPRKFAVKNLNGRWVLPSHSNYPADKKQQLVDAASSLVGLKALSDINVNPEKYELYGVLDPTDVKPQAGTTGVGKLVTFKDGSSKMLAKLIIGKQPTEQGHAKENNELRYVRIAGEAPIYIVKLAADKFSPKFEDWIETQLLSLNEFDIREVMIRDYIFRPEAQTPPVPKSVALLKFDGQKAEWSLEKLVEFINSQPKEIALTDKEELNTAKLDGLKSALNELKIVNVFRKPQGLINTLRGEGAGLDEEAQASLATRGFYLLPLESGGSHLMSRDGEVSVSLRNGVVYTLRFGNFDKSLSNVAESEPESNDSSNAASKTPTLANRYLMVEASFNPDLIPKPMLEEVPAEVSSEKKEEANKAESKPAETKNTETKPASEAKPESTKEPAKDQTPAKDNQQSSLQESPFRTAAFQPPAKDALKKDDSAAASESKTPDSITTEPKAAEAKSTDTKVEPGTQPAEVKPADANDPANPNFERNQILRRNEAQQQAYNAKIQAGLLRAKMLNERFAEWYYVIPDEVYKKIHLGKNDIIMPLQPETTPRQRPGLQGLPPGFPPPGLMPGGN